MDKPEFPDHATALVQGASRGIGLALTRALAEDPRFTTVVACCREPARAASLAELAASASGRITTRSVDITREESVRALGQSLDQDGLRPSLVLNVSGLLHDEDGLQPEKRLEDLEFAQLERVFAVNALGPALMLRELLPRMARSDKAVFAALSARVGSISDNRLGGWYAYRASKAALNQLLRTASIEARRRFRNVILAALHPGTTDTGLSRPFQANVPEGKLFSTDFVAERLLAVIDQIQVDDSGEFFAWDGERIPW
ncbi:MAG: SDR family NAD(P)-dependent oxidoreductase [Wenzhouxiangella sp.]|nr:MAG: SDR family NAD(P)-dependent oxidoreductase [Wenzhouxiangella sp.]